MLLSTCRHLHRLVKGVGAGDAAGLAVEHGLARALAVVERKLGALEAKLPRGVVTVERQHVDERRRHRQARDVCDAHCGRGGGLALEILDEMLDELPARPGLAGKLGRPARLCTGAQAYVKVSGSQVAMLGPHPWLYACTATGVATLKRVAARLRCCMVWKHACSAGRMVRVSGTRT